ncbi:hypothetical protein IW140_000141 [Coemansia sp. RSA 1813]|nr:hypothetical protein EV178_000054 [Coemansia sp. RSA 1646]KAJ1772306.1 hypothetical protein LPJ74_001571 [Coemansia sp. RSA 1843]KAJ2093246.1 hypothetical protein IW138_000539 [Coemansia sp. RSA 986]KAJ2217489.1 hypothetical protein EV179_000323 [Coemansia sp. RSA 487]KAJ2573499.1 hypothetical protein IW140_000141 [Coemansia sp. RSA 1813]
MYKNVGDKNRRLDTKHDARINQLVDGFGDAGHRLFQALSGKYCTPLPKELMIHSLILSGRSGIGKTLLLTKLAEHFDCTVVRIHMGRLIATGNQHFSLKQRLDNVAKDKRVLVWLKDIELFRGLYAGVVESFMKGINNMPLCVLAMTTRSPDSILGSIRFICEDHIRLLAPSKEERLHLCQWFTEDKLPYQTIIDTVEVTHGKLATEIFAALLDLLKTKNEHQLNAHETQSSALLHTKVTWEDVGGLEDVIKELHESVVWPVMNRDRFLKLGIKPTRGILLYGPPGTGKTMLAKAIATEVSANFISIAIPDLIKGEFGESEKALAAIFENAKRSPSILFLDEIEAIFGSRENAGQLGKKLISQLFLEMDNIPNDSRLVILAATNAPDLIDDSIQRPGRLDKRIYIPLPSESGRLDILRRSVRHLSIGDCDSVLQAMAKHQLSGAEIKLLVRGACYVAIRNNRENLERSDFEIALLENKRVSSI